MSSRVNKFLIVAVSGLWAMAPLPALGVDKNSNSSNPAVREVIAAVPKSWPPQYDVDKAGQPIGFAIDVIEAIAARAGLRITYRVMDTFADVDRMMDNGAADIIPNSGITPERSDRYYFTDPVETIAIAIFVRHNTRDIGGIADLAGRRVGVVATGVAQNIVRDHPEIKAVVHSDQESALFQLLAGLTDAVITPRPVFRRLARHAGVEDRIKEAGKPQLEIKRAIRVQKNNPALLAVLDEAVKDFVKTPAYRQIYVKWYGAPASFWTTSRVTWTMGTVLAILLIAVAFWLYRLMLDTNRRLAANEEKFRDLVEGAVPGVMIHRGHKPLFVNQAYADIFGYASPAEILRQPSALDHVAPRERGRLSEYAEARLRGEKIPDVYEFQGRRKDGSAIWLENRGRVVDWEGSPAIQRTVVEITRRKEAEEQLLSRTRQQAVVAELSQYALMKWDLSVLMNTAVVLVAKILDAHCCKVLEWLPESEELILRAGVGFRPGLVGKTRLSSKIWGQAGFTLQCRDAVVVEDLATEKRFDGPQILLDHGIVSGVSVIIGDVEEPFGVLGVHSKTRRKFSDDDILFLKTIAALLGSVISRRQSEEALRKSEGRLRGAIDSLQEGFSLYDSADRLVAINDVYRRMTPIGEKHRFFGMRFEEVIRVLVEKGIIADAVGREEEFIRERIEQHRNPKGAILRRHSDGRWYMIKETRTPEGGTAVTYSDITELKNTEKALLESREQLRAVIDNLPSAVTLKDRLGRFLLVNRTFASWMNAAPEAIVGKTLMEVLPEHAKTIMEYDRAIHRAGDIATFEMTICYPDGVTRDLLVTKGPVHMTTNEIVSVCTVITDITALKQADQALRDAEYRFKIVVDNLPMGVNVIDRDGRYLLVNKKFEELYGMSEDRILGHLPEEISHFMEAPAAGRKAHEQSVFNDRKVIARTLKVTHADGLSHDFEITKFPIVGDDGEVALIGTIATDVTDRQRAEQELTELRTLLAHVSRVSTMGEMAAGLAHELNQPLTAITNYAKGSLRRLDAGGRPADLLPILELIADQALRAGDIIRKIRGFMNRTEPHKSQIDLGKTINEVIALIAGEVHMGGVEIVVDVPAKLQPVMADPIQVQQVLLNLIRNAISAMNGDGSNHHRLEIGAIDQFGNDVEIYVSDNGPGVPADVTDRLFEPFFTTKTDGLGMGLSISRTIVTGHGASFHFTLPTVPGDPHARA